MRCAAFMIHLTTWEFLFTFQHFLTQVLQTGRNINGMPLCGSITSVSLITFKEFRKSLLLTLLSGNWVLLHFVKFIRIQLLPCAQDVFTVNNLMCLKFSSVHINV